MPRRIKSALGLLQQTASDWMSDNAPRLGASLAYYTVFAISPLMLIAVGMAELWFGQEVAREEVFDQISTLIGHEGAEAVQVIINNAQKPGTGVWATTAAVITFLIGSTGVFVELQDALNTIWGVKVNSSSSWFSFFRNRLLSFAMVLAIGFLLLVSLLLSAALAAVGKYLSGIAPEWQVLGFTLNFALSFAVITFLFALIFKFLPDVRIAWKDVWIGAVITALLFTFGKFLLGLYLGRSSVASAYGAAGSLVVILIWVYYSAQIVFFGAEFTQVYADASRRKLEPVDYADPIHVEDTVPAALKRRCDHDPALLENSGQPAAEACSEAPKPPERRGWSVAFGLCAMALVIWLKDRKRLCPNREDNER